MCGLDDPGIVRSMGIEGSEPEAERLVDGSITQQGHPFRAAAARIPLDTLDETPGRGGFR